MRVRESAPRKEPQEITGDNPERALDASLQVGLAFRHVTEFDAKLAGSRFERSAMKLGAIVHFQDRGHPEHRIGRLNVEAIHDLGLNAHVQDSHDRRPRGILGRDMPAECHLCRLAARMGQPNPIDLLRRPTIALCDISVLVDNKNVQRGMVDFDDLERHGRLRSALDVAKPLLRLLKP